MTIGELIDELRLYPNDMDVRLYTGESPGGEIGYCDKRNNEDYVTIYGKEE